MNDWSIEMVRLSDMGAGEGGVIRSIEDGHHYLNLLEMGFLPGEQVVVENMALRRDPISVRIAESQISLRKEEAGCIIVERTTI